MIDEAVLEDLLAELADEIPLPADGLDHVVDALTHSSPSSGERRRLAKPLLLIAAVIALIALLVPVVNHSSTSSESAKTDAAAPPATTPAAVSAPARGRTITGTGPGNGSAGSATGYTPPAIPPDTGSGDSTPGPVDGAKIVKTGTLDLLVPHATLRVAVNRVTGTAVGLGGYVADSKTSSATGGGTAEITIRVPVAQFDTAIARLEALPGIKVLGDSENGADVTGQFTDLQAQLRAATAERDALLGVLARAQSIGDILAVHDRVTAAQTAVDQLQGRINVLNGQTTFSSIAVTLSEKSASFAPAAHHAAPETGLAKAWSDARQGFANAIEWLIARSGGALIVVLFALALLFGIRYLYPVVRRGLV